MINPKIITAEWLKAVSDANRKADLILVEKVIRSLILLEGLVKQKLNFVFKGGTALMLHFNSTKRLSIDIDIIIPGKGFAIDELLDKTALEQGFLRKVHQHRKNSSKINKAHYKFFYTPVYKSKTNEEYVLLDILFEDINYKKIVSIPIQSSFLPENLSPLNVKVPSMEDILGDKLTAFAPNTTGIPYIRNKDSMSMEIIKQLYDIGNLFDHVKVLEIIKFTFKKFAIIELGYRGMDNLSESDVLEDIYQTALSIVSRGADGKGNFDQLQSGIRQVKGFIFSESYHLEKAIAHASKTAYLASLIRYNASSIIKYDSKFQMNDWFIDKPLNTKLNRFKKSDPESFFYWYKIYELIKEIH